MTVDMRWTIRNVTDDARAMIDEVHEVTGIPYGRLLTEAINQWYQELPDEDPRPSFRCTAGTATNKIAEEYSLTD